MSPMNPHGPKFDGSEPTSYCRCGSVTLRTDGGRLYCCGNGPGSRQGARTWPEDAAHRGRIYLAARRRPNPLPARAAWAAAGDATRVLDVLLLWYKKGTTPAGLPPWACELKANGLPAGPAFAAPVPRRGLLSDPATWDWRGERLPKQEGRDAIGAPGRPVLWILPVVGDPETAQELEGLGEFEKARTPGAVRVGEGRWYVPGEDRHGRRPPAGASRQVCAEFRAAELRREIRHAEAWRTKRAVSIEFLAVLSDGTATVETHVPSVQVTIYPDDHAPGFTVWEAVRGAIVGGELAGACSQLHDELTRRAGLLEFVGRGAAAKREAWGYNVQVGTGDDSSDFECVESYSDPVEAWGMVLRLRRALDGTAERVAVRNPFGHDAAKVCEAAYDAARKVTE